MCSPRLRINITEVVLDVSQLFHLTVLCTFVPPNNLFWTLNVFDAMNVFSMTSMTRCVCFRRCESLLYDFYDAVWMFSTYECLLLWLLWRGVYVFDAMKVLAMTSMTRSECFRRCESLLYDFYDAVFLFDAMKVLSMTYMTRCVFWTLWQSSLWLVWCGVYVFDAMKVFSMTSMTRCVCFRRCESLLYDLYDAVCVLDAVKVFSRTSMTWCVCLWRCESPLYDFYDAVCVLDAVKIFSMTSVSRCVFQSATFQVVIAADEFNTILIFNYAKMEIPYQTSYLVCLPSIALRRRSCSLLSFLSVCLFCCIVFFVVLFVVCLFCFVVVVDICGVSFAGARDSLVNAGILLLVMQFINNFHHYTTINEPH